MHSAFIWRTARRLGLPPYAADDVLQEVLIVAARRLSDIVVGSERAFLYRTTAHITREMRKRLAKVASRTGAEGSLEAAPDPAPDAEEMLGHEQARRLLDEALDALVPELREVFVLFEIEALATAEIAAMVGIPEGTVASRLRRAREKFSESCARVRARHGLGRSR